MKYGILLLIAFTLGSLPSFAQKAKQVTRKIDKNEKETYTIIKPKGETPYKTGEYTRYNKYQILEKGEYLKDKKVGEWQTYGRDINRKYFYTQTGHLDSTYYDGFGKQYGTKYTKEGKELNRYYYVSFRTTKIKKVKNGKLYLVLQSNGYIQGDTIIQGLLKNKKKDGIWHYKYMDGSSSKVNYSEGKLNGAQLSYYPNGQIQCTKTYTDKSKLTGAMTVFYPNGDTLLSEHYVNGKMDGPAFSKYPNNKYFIQATLESGKLITYTEYDKIGSIVSKSSVKEGNGIVYEYTYQKGKLTALRASNYEKGVLQGKSYTFDSDTILSIQEYKDGKFQRYTKKPAYALPPETSTIAYYNQELAFLDTTQLIKATFESGEIGLQRFIAENVTYPPVAIENDVQGQVYVMFVIDTQGDVRDAKILGSKKGFGLDKESIRVIQATSGKWIPATQYGLPAQMRFRIPVKYQLF